MASVVFFICKFELIKLQGAISLSLEFTKNQLAFPYFLLQYQYKAPNVVISEARADKVNLHKMAVELLHRFYADSSGGEGGKAQ